MGGIRAAHQMQLLVIALFGIASPYMLIVPGVDKKFDEDGNLLDKAFENSIHNFVTEYLWLAEKIQPPVPSYPDFIGAKEGEQPPVPLKGELRSAHAA